MYPTGTTIYDPEKAWNGNEVWRFDRFEEVFFKEAPADEEDSKEDEEAAEGMDFRVVPPKPEEEE